MLAELILIDVLLEEHGHLLPASDVEQMVLDIEQAILNESNEKGLKEMAGRTDNDHYRNLSLYQFVLNVAWEHQDTKSVDEGNLLRKLRGRLGLTSREHRLIESKLGKYPKDHNEPHTKTEISDTVRELERLGLLFEVRDNDGQDHVVIAEEIADVMRAQLGIEIRRQGYEALLQHKAVRSKDYMTSVLDKSSVPHSAAGTLAELQQRVMETIRPSVVLGGHSPQDGLSNETLRAWCSDLGLPVGGTKPDRIQRLIDHYDQLRVRFLVETDEREVWYCYYCDLATRSAEVLRQQHVIDKDIEIERHFEDATSFLFETKLNHTPLRQAGTEHCDGLLSFRDQYIMWDNKSCEGPVSLKDHIKQFNSYMDKAEKPVPVFLVIAPDFTEDSEAVALRYTADRIDRSICLVPAGELKGLAEYWAGQDNRKRTEPFPLGMFARPGRFRFETIRMSLG